MNRWALLLCILLSGLLVGPAVTYAQRFAEQRYGITEGLDNVRIYFLQADTAGRIWVATDWGLDFLDREHQLINSRKLSKLPKEQESELIARLESPVVGSQISRQPLLIFQNSQVFHCIDPDDIIYCESANRQINVYGARCHERELGLAQSRRYAYESSSIGIRFKLS